MAKRKKKAGRRVRRSVEEQIADLEAEIERRRAVAAVNPMYQGVDYDDLLQAKGLSIEALRRDPAIQVSALAQMWVDRSRTDADLRETYEAEREMFDGRYGEGVEVRVLLLRAAKYKNELIQRTFEEAEEELARLRAQMRAAGETRGFQVYYPRPAFCTDNGAMIAYAGWCRRERLQPGMPKLFARPRWPLDELDGGA